MAEEYEVRFVYRVLNKTTEGYQLLEVKDKIFDMYQDVTWTDGENTYWPVDPKDVEDLREKGVLLTEIRGHLHLVTQEIIGTSFHTLILISCQLLIGFFQRSQSSIGMEN